jgi:hypothetical protein
MIEVEQLQTELRKLKRGEGIAAAALPSAVGSGLRQLCDWDDSQSPEILRARLAELIRAHAEPLPPHQRMAVLAALGLHPEAQHRFLSDRLRWLRNQIDRDVERTADRLANRAIQRVAQGMCAQWAARRSNRRVPTEWYTGRLEATIRLDLEQPEFRERRTIVARENGLREVPLAPMVPKAAGADSIQILPEIVSGGTLVGWTRVAPTMYSGTLRLPAPVPAGGRHEYELIYRSSMPGAVQPIYLITPVLQCDHLTVRVRFPPPTDGVTVWRLDGVYRGIAEDPLAADVPTVDVNEDGWAEASFESLALGLTYGVRWEHAPAAQPA